MSAIAQDRPPKDLKLAVDQLWQKISNLTALVNRSVNLKIKTAVAPAAVVMPAASSSGSGGSSGDYEPLISKSPGYARYTGASWIFQLYARFPGLTAVPTVVNGELIVFWLLAEPGKIYALFGDGTPAGTTYCIFDGTGVI